MSDDRDRRSCARVHVSLYVADLERSTAFYEALLGVPAHRVRPGYAELDLAEPGLRLALHEIPPGGTGGLNHLGVQFASAQELEASRERLAAAGCRTRDVAESTCRLAGCRTRQATHWVAAPDGTRWELYAETSEANGSDQTPEEDAHQ
jgi:lactoylglutathione lyase